MTETDDESQLIFARESLEVRVPSAWGLVVESPRGSWGYARGAQQGDELWVFHQPARRTIQLAECEEDARRNLLRLRHGIEATNERPWSPIVGYTGTLRIFLLEEGETLVEGYAVGVSRCLSVAYSVKSGRDYALRLRQVVLNVLGQMSLLQRSVTAAQPQF